MPLGVARHFELKGGDAEGLLVKWLSGLAYWAEAEGLVLVSLNCTASLRPT